MTAARFGVGLVALGLLLAGSARAAQPDDGQAALDLGLGADLGVGGVRDPATARRWYRLAAERGSAAGAFNEGALLASGEGGGRDPTQAATWYGRAAARGHARAAFALAQLYASGDGVPQNLTLAAAWAHVAAAGGVSAATAEAAGGPAPSQAGTLPAPEAIVPDGVVRLAGTPPGTEFVWRSPAGAHSFFIQVIKLGASPAQVAAAFTDVSAALLPLPAEAGPYAWRVYGLDAAASHYAAGEWHRFVVVADGSSR